MTSPRPSDIVIPHVVQRMDPSIERGFQGVGAIVPSKVPPKILITLGLLAVGFAVLFGVGLKGSLVYYLTVSEFLDQPAERDLGDNFRIHGTVVEGTIERPANSLGARFLMTDGRSELPVVYDKETPDTFVDGAEVVVEGALAPDGVFIAHTLLAKCPSKYEAAKTGGEYEDASGPTPSSGTRDAGAPPS